MTALRPSVGPEALEGPVRGQAGSERALSLSFPGVAVERLRNALEHSWVGGKVMRWFRRHWREIALGTLVLSAGGYLLSQRERVDFSFLFPQREPPVWVTPVPVVPVDVQEISTPTPFSPATPTPMATEVVDQGEEDASFFATPTEVGMIPTPEDGHGQAVFSFDLEAEREELRAQGIEDIEDKSIANLEGYPETIEIRWQPQDNPYRIVTSPRKDLSDEAKRQLIDVVEKIFDDAEEVWIRINTFWRFQNEAVDYGANYLYRRDTSLERIAYAKDFYETGRMPGSKLVKILKAAERVGVSQFREEIGKRPDYEYKAFYVIIFSQITEEGATVVIYVTEDGTNYELLEVTQVEF